MTFEVSDFTDVADGSYPATLAGVEVKKGGFGGADYRRWSWLVEVVNKETGEVEIVPLDQLTSMNTGPQSNSYKQLTALLGAAPKAGEKIEAPTGKRVTLTIGHNEKGFPKVIGCGPFVDPQATLPGIPR